MAVAVAVSVIVDGVGRLEVVGEGLIWFGARHFWCSRLLG